MTKKDENLNEEFLEFLSASPIQPSARISEQILSRVHRELNPPRGRLFMKILGIHAFVSVVSLSVCSQFGVQAFPLYDAMNSFMQVMGHTYCLAVCGFLYLAASSLTFSFVLTPEEIRAIRKDRYSLILALAGVSLGVFLCVGTEVLALPSVFWLGGALVGGFGAFEVGWKLRSKFRQTLVHGI